MRAVVPVEHGVIEINYMWLPTCIGMNAVLKQEMEAAISSRLTGRALDDQSLDAAHDIVIEFLEKKFPDVNGLARFLDGMKYLELRR